MCSYATQVPVLGYCIIWEGYKKSIHEQYVLFFKEIVGYV